MFSTLKKVFSTTALAAVFTASPLALADYSEHPEAKAFIAKMVNEYGLSEKEVVRILKDANKQQSILDAIARPAEKTKPWFEYRNIFLGESRITQGVEFWAENADTLAKASKEFGVPEQIIVAIIGVETRYGRHAGSYRVIDALTTLGFDYPPRSTFFAKELENFLLLTTEQKQNPLALKGSYAGAMGYGQFMPSSYRAYAVDFDGDKKADIWNNPKDAIGSVANYFRAHKWQTGEPVMVRARIAEGYDESILDSRSRPSLTATEVAAKGFTPVDVEIPGDTKVMPIAYDGEKGKEYWLGYDNFYVITRYNRSHMYARAVWELSEEILYRHNNPVPAPVATP
ncbi:lytic murein transglycosylase B [Saccharophagus degradans]|uniref:Lytic murein transglycosylase B n=1 Tax=Saccharophagus degradans TaxID=86304 RepID=A0AAW7XBW2_9GAMM|nr:lytic murein transglycosylase B [Saccharophagus degradans]MBU2987007.1 lytic murein transglycosylase B [Saccharophagus degradans]MDO6424411.1 lytic murein transglycosylase B [Saccharophagus degradans]MDO6608382.1 lytic murein transglycosylase B [Saccharophagus degradans]WGO99225.1 lytic murein transglycosylase B [Saccharophagus degradans]